MPSPFPGMDPYLEGSLWSTVHIQLSAEIARQLSLKLSEKYVALTNERFVLHVPEDTSVAVEAIYPDTALLAAGKNLSETPVMTGATALSPPLRFQTVMLEHEPQVTVEIRDAANRRLVTAIEVLSPTNKQGSGYVEYLTKRDALLRSDTHLIEIDLLRRGRRAPMRQPLPSAPYFIFVSRADERPTVGVWPILLDQTLPACPVPLLSGDLEVMLDLQLAFTIVYDISHYERLIEYASSPEAPLEGAGVVWAAEVIQQAKA